MCDAAQLESAQMTSKSYSAQRSVTSPGSGSNAVQVCVKPDDGDESSQVHTELAHLLPKAGGKFKMPQGLFNALIAAMFVVTSVMRNVSLPIFTGTMVNIGGDAFVVLISGEVWFTVIFIVMTLFLKYTVDRTISLLPGSSWKIMCAIGSLTSVNAALVVFASPPSRTAPYLQGILSTCIIPFTVVIRLIILKKGISLRRLMCTGIILVGLFITVEPQIWNLPGSGGSASHSDDGAGRILWPLVFALGFLPAAVSIVLSEKVLHQDETGAFSFITWTQIFQLLAMIPLFWTDFVPRFGMASSPSEFLEHLKMGLKCMFSSAEECQNLVGKAWLFFASYCFSSFFQFLLIKYAEGAVYTVVVQSLVTPTATLFWTFFNFDVSTNIFSWSPSFTMTTGFTIAGLIIITPAVLLYRRFSVGDAEQQKQREVNINDAT